MPILSPETNRVLQALNQNKPQESNSTLKDSLDNQGLGIDALLSELATVVFSGGSDITKLSAIEKALKMHGALKENQAPPPVPINIIINDPHKPENSVLPILIPRGVELSDKVQ